MTSLPLKIVKFTEYVILCDTSPELEFMLPLCKLSVTVSSSRLTLERSV